MIGVMATSVTDSGNWPWLHVLLCLELIHVSQVWCQTTPYFAIGSTVYSDPDLELPISIIGRGGAGPGEAALACFLDNPADSTWYYPDGSAVAISTEYPPVGTFIYVRRDEAITLHRDPAAFSPIGRYCCGLSTAPVKERLCVDIVLCSLLTAPTNGGISYSDMSRGMGTVATYSCNPGFELMGDLTRTCTSADTWSGMDASCQATAVDCGQPPNPDNGLVDVSSGTIVNSVAEYSCNVGYNLIGAMAQVCSISGSWTPVAPTCNPVDCGPLPNPANGQTMAPSGTTFNNMATYSCNPGFVLIGDTSQTCGSNGMWSPDAPACELPYIGFGTTAYTDILISMIGRGGADPGEAALACFLDNPANSTWYYPDGSAVAISTEYPPVGTFIYMRRDEAITLHRDPAAFSPIGRYCCGLSTAPVEERLCVNVALCSLLTPPTNGAMITYSDDTRGMGTVATYSCNTGYEVMGNVNRTCTSADTWSGMDASCQVVDCGQPLNPSNGQVDVSSGTTYNSLAEYSCDVGYILTGAVAQVCRTDGSWTPAAPTCDPVDCGSLTNPDNGQVMTPSGTTLSSVATYSCTTGYNLIGSGTQTCGSNGMWTPAAPTCEAIGNVMVTTPVANTADDNIAAYIGGAVAVILIVCIALVFLVIGITYLTLKHRKQNKQLELTKIQLNEVKPLSIAPQPYSLPIQQPAQYEELDQYQGNITYDYIDPPKSNPPTRDYEFSQCPAYQTSVLGERGTSTADSQIPSVDGLYDN